MRGFGWFLAAALVMTSSATIIDRIAVVVNKSIVKDSDINRDIRLVYFMNGQKLIWDTAARKEAANRLIDQQFIRTEITAGDYPEPSASAVDQMLAETQKSRFASEQQFEETLKSYGITEPELKQYLHWQLTVLQFIDVRFRPAVLVTDEDIKKYYDAHLAELTRDHPNQAHTLPALKDEIEQALVGERVNDQFYTWLDRRRKSAKIEFHEEGLQ
jgi:hypothetical protein